MEVVASTSQVSGKDSSEKPRQLIVIDDDDLSREVLSLIAMEAGFEVESFASGEDAVATLAPFGPPAAILADMQMPGIAGQALAKRLRSICGEATTILAMSGSPVAQEKLAGYNGFLLKPFSAEDLKAACDRTTAQEAAGTDEGTGMLNEAVFDHFARSMPAGQVFGLYKMCLDDSGKRLRQMRAALEARDDTGYRKAAHAIKGGCGMVGALELAKLAAEMEQNGLPAEHDATPLDHFLAASERLGRMLDNKASGSRADATIVRALTTFD